VRGFAIVAGLGNWPGLALTLTTRIIPDLTPPATLCFLGGSQMGCASVPGVSALTRTVSLCSPNVTLDTEIVFYNVPATSGPQQGKSLRAMDDEAISKGNARLAELRREKRKAYDAIGAALANKVMAVELLPLEAVIDMTIAKQLCADWKVMVGGYKRRITLDKYEGGVRLYFDGDSRDDFPSNAPRSSNNPKAETDVPPFDQSTGFLFRPEANGTVTQTVGTSMAP